MDNNRWLPARLADHVAIKHGYAFKGEYFTDEPTYYILLTPGNFALGGGFQSGKAKYYSGPIPEDYVLKEGDLLVTMTDLSKTGDTLGYPAFVPQSSAVRYLHNQRLGLVEVHNGTTIDKAFLYYRLRLSDYRHFILGSASGSTVRHTSPSRILDFAFNLPPLPEQRAIAAVLGALDDKIELNRRMNATLEGLARALFRSWFVDFDPVRAKMDRRHNVGAGLVPAQEGPAQEGNHKGLPLPPAIDALFPDEMEVGEDGGERPRGWGITTIGDLARIVGGSTPSTKEPRFWNDGKYYWTTPKDLSSLTVPVLLGSERKITDQGLKQISSGLLPQGTVLLSSRAPIGYLAISEVPTAVNQGFIAMLPNEGVSNVFLMRWAEVAHDDIVARANGSTFLEISKTNFRPIELLVPPDEIMAAFDRVARPLHERIVINERQSRTLAALRDGLLPGLMSGAVRVTQTEEAMTRAL